jgi:hypothetical protein
MHASDLPFGAFTQSIEVVQAGLLQFNYGSRYFLSLAIVTNLATPIIIAEDPPPSSPIVSISSLPLVLLLALYSGSRARDGAHGDGSPGEIGPGDWNRDSGSVSPCAIVLTS